MRLATVLLIRVRRYTFRVHGEWRLETLERDTRDTRQIQAIYGKLCVRECVYVLWLGDALCSALNS